MSPSERNIPTDKFRSTSQYERLNYAEGSSGREGESIRLYGQRARDEGEQEQQQQVAGIAIGADKTSTEVEYLSKSRCRSSKAYSRVIQRCTVLSVTDLYCETCFEVPAVLVIMVQFNWKVSVGCFRNLTDD
ncbi:hypothetical protein Trydic_g3191 [Trypoxylus dichotomus]